MMVNLLVSCYWIAKSSESSTLRMFDHPKDGYVRDSWEDVFSSSLSQPRNYWLAIFL